MASLLIYYTQESCKIQREILQPSYILSLEKSVNHYYQPYKKQILQTLCNTCSFQFVIKFIADSSNRLYVNWLAGIILYLFPYVTDMADDNVVITEIWFFPNTIIYLLFTKHSARISC